MEESEITQVADYYKLMGDENRLKICRILASNMKETVSVNDITTILDISQPAVSRHLKLLSDFGILNKRKIGANIYYSINHERLEQLVNMTFEFMGIPLNYIVNI